MFSLVTLILYEFAHYRVNYVNVMTLMQCAYLLKWRLENIISVPTLGAISFDILLSFDFKLPF